jgi:6-phosphogluconolactonase
MFGELVVVDDVADAFAGCVIDAYQQRSNEDFAIALSGGGTARACYERLADRGEAIDWWQVEVFWGDERCVPPESPDSNERLGREALLERVGGAQAVHPMRCDEGPDRYQLLLGEVGQLDVIHLGLGPDGHTASLFPESPGLDADPGRLVVLNHDPLGNNPFERMTLTFSGISRGRLVVFTVAGEAKREAMQKIADGVDLPAARVRADRVIWLVDRAAAPEPTR